VRRACTLATGGLWPDLTILLDVPPALGSARRASAGSAPDRIESEDGGFHDRVAAGFRELAAADPDGWIVIDGMLSADEVALLVRRAVEKRLDGATGG